MPQDTWLSTPSPSPRAGLLLERRAPPSFYRGPLQTSSAHLDRPEVPDRQGREHDHDLGGPVARQLPASVQHLDRSPARRVLGPGIPHRGSLLHQLDLRGGTTLCLSVRRRPLLADTPVKLRARGRRFV